MIMTAAVTITALGFALPGRMSAQTVTAYNTGERITGMTKQCIYDGLGSEYTRTVSSVALCPLSIRVETMTARTEASRRPRNEWQALGDGLRDIGAILQRDRDRREWMELERERLGLERAMVNTSRTEVFRLDNLLPEEGDKAEAGEARVRWETEGWAYRLLVEILMEEYKATDEYKVAVELYFDIRDTDGPKTASRFWKRVEAQGETYVQRRWQEIAPRW